MKSVLGHKGLGHIGISHVNDRNAIMDAMKEAIHSPLLETDIRNADALPESAIQAIAREDLKHNTYASDSEEFEMRLMNLCIRHGTGAKASYATSC